MIYELSHQTDLLNQITQEHREVEGWQIVSSDGMPLAGDAPSRLEPELFAAVATAAAQKMQQLAGGLSLGGVTTGVIEVAVGYAVFGFLPHGNLVVLLVRKAAHVGASINLLSELTSLQENQHGQGSQEYPQRLPSY